MISLTMLKHSHNKEYGAATEFGWGFLTEYISVQLKQVITALFFLIVLQNHKKVILTKHKAIND